MPFPSRPPLRVIPIVLVIAVACGCGDSTKPSKEANFGTMQVLAINAPVGSMAYFTLLWPQVEVALADNPAFATLEPSSQGHLIAGDAAGNKEWFASSKAPWIDAMGRPYPGMEITAFLSGTNKTHTLTGAAVDLMASGMSMLAGIAAQQVTVREPVLPVVAVHSPFYGTADGAPDPAYVATAAEMITLYQTTYNVDLTPTQEELDLLGYDPTHQLGWEREFVQLMAVAAKALRTDRSNMIIVNMAGTDPHGAFNDLQGLTRQATTLQNALNGFYELLAAKKTFTGSRADRVVITIQGDTPKNSLVRAGWPDGTPGGCNWIYVVGKGMLKHGWFGRIHADGTVSGYDPQTGADDPNRTAASTVNQTAAAVAYAATRRDAAFIETVLQGGALSEYEAVIQE